jgi:hypothetical protein
MVTLTPLFFHPLAGVTVPPVPALIVRKYCAVKLAVYVLLVAGATVCEMVPPSLQLVHLY